MKQNTNETETGGNELNPLLAVGFSTPTTEECYDAKKLRFQELDEAGCFPSNVKLRWEELKRYLADNTP